MRILLVSARFPPTIKGGGEISALELAKALNIENEVFILSTSERANSYIETVEGLTIYRMKYTRSISRTLGTIYNEELLFLLTMLNTKRVIKKVNPEIIHALNMLVMPGVALGSKNIPLVATVNSPWLTCFTKDGMDLTGTFCVNCSWKKLYNCVTQKGGPTSLQNYFLRHLRWIYGLFQTNKRRFFARRYNFIALSKPIKDLLILNGYDPSNICVIPNFVDFESFRPFISRENLRKKLGVSQDNKLIMYAGRIVKSKGLDYLLRAMSELVMQQPNVKLLVLGKGHYKRELIRIARQLFIDNHIIFKEFVSHQEMPNFYNASDIIVLPSAWFDPLPRLLIESMALEKPVVATNVGGVPDIVINGKTGLLCEPRSIKELREKISCLISDEDLAKRLAKNGNNLIQKRFSKDVILPKLLKFYQQMID